MRHEFGLPSAGDMLDDIRAQRAWRRTKFQPQAHRGGITMPYTQQVGHGNWILHMREIGKERDRANTKEWRKQERNSRLLLFIAFRAVAGSHRAVRYLLNCTAAPNAVLIVLPQSVTVDVDLTLMYVHTLQYHDQLLRDLGVEEKRKGWNPFAECFTPYSAADYAHLFDARLKQSEFQRVKKAAAAAARQPQSELGVCAPLSTWRVCTAVVVWCTPGLLQSLIFFLSAFPYFPHVNCRAGMRSEGRSGLAVRRLGRLCVNSVNTPPCLGCHRAAMLLHLRPKSNPIPLMSQLTASDSCSLPSTWTARCTLLRV